MTGNGFQRIGFAALSAGLDRAAWGAIRAGDLFIRLARSTGVGTSGARICIAVANALGRASESARRVAFPRLRA